jgi:hypothetical protein
LVIKQEIKILVETKQAENSPQIFSNWRLSLNRQKSQDFRQIDKSLKILSYFDNVLCSMNRPLGMSHRNLRSGTGMLAQVL